MFYVSSSVSERYVNPLFEVFDGGDFILSSYRDIEEDFARMRIFFEEKEQVSAARRCLESALEIVGVKTEIEVGELADEDWKFAYRRHFKTEFVSERICTVPEWEWNDLKRVDGKVYIRLDPGMAFGTGKHETTKACLQFIDEVSSTLNPQFSTFLDMGCGSGILSIAAAKLGFGEVSGFDVDQEAVDASNENAAKNGVKIAYRRFALGRAGNLPLEPADLVAANILGPLLIRFADEIAPASRGKLIISGILDELYPEVLAAYVKRGFRELKRKTIGEWTTGLLERIP